MEEKYIYSDEENQYKFDQMIAPYRHDLKRFCLKKAGSEWDGEDLFQETLVKAYVAFQRLSEMEMNKSYLYRIATNAWIDLCRKKKVTLDTFEEDKMLHGHSSGEFAVRESIESLASQLPAKQAVIVLLMDVFQFTAKETAEMLADKEGAIHTALYRARKKLQSLTKELLEGDTSSSYARNLRDKNNISTHTNDDRLFGTQLIESLVNGFRKRNPTAIIEAYLALANHGVKVESISRSGSKLFFYLQDPDGNILMISS